MLSRARLAFLCLRLSLASTGSSGAVVVVIEETSRGSANNGEKRRGL
jgi:hypothetical protein